MQLARGDKNLHVLRGVRSPTLVIGVPCPTLILVNYVRGVRSPTLIYALKRTYLDYIIVRRRKNAYAHVQQSIYNRSYGL